MKNFFDVILNVRKQEKQNYVNQKQEKSSKNFNKKVRVFNPKFYKNFLKKFR